MYVHFRPLDYNKVNPDPTVDVGAVLGYVNDVDSVRTRGNNTLLL